MGLIIRQFLQSLRALTKWESSSLYLDADLPLFTVTGRKAVNYKGIYVRHHHEFLRQPFNACISLEAKDNPLRVQWQNIRAGYADLCFKRLALGEDCGNGYLNLNIQDVGDRQRNFHKIFTHQ
jgi:hypothetical protein